MRKVLEADPVHRVNNVLPSQMFGSVPTGFVTGVSAGSTSAISTFTGVAKPHPVPASGTLPGPTFRVGWPVVIIRRVYINLTEVDIQSDPYGYQVFGFPTGRQVVEVDVTVGTDVTEEAPVIPRVESLREIVEKIKVFQPLRPSSEMRTLAQRVLESLEQRKDEDIDAWAERLGRDLAEFND